MSFAHCDDLFVLCRLFFGVGSVGVRLLLSVGCLWLRVVCCVVCCCSLRVLFVCCLVAVVCCSLCVMCCSCCVCCLLCLACCSLFVVC